MELLQLVNEWIFNIVFNQISQIEKPKLYCSWFYTKISLFQKKVIDVFKEKQIFSLGVVIIQQNNWK